ncbi:hypothetical protein BKA65DRAFT_501523 [Rhexocercosporidium sp. MPI-PUGE-AT-0058]|nr:hypothetical protein BKA65DRAFT_501523 [Rhexocercosporidium sp. MPI-PUGE-AT-0058]
MIGRLAALPTRALRLDFFSTSFLLQILESLSSSVAHSHTMASSIASTDLGDHSSRIDTASAPDPDIAGIGVIISFIITFVVAISLCIDIGIYQVGLRKRSSLFIKVEEKVLLGFSDQILITGFGLQLAGFIKLKELSIYHQGIITYLATLSTSCHSLSVIILRGYFHSHALARETRIGFMTISMLFLTVNLVVLQLGPGFIAGAGPAFQIYAPPGRSSYTTMNNQRPALGTLLGSMSLSTTFVVFWYTYSHLTSPKLYRTWFNPSASATGIIFGMEVHRWLVALNLCSIPFMPLSFVFSSILPYFLEAGVFKTEPPGGADGDASERSWGYGQITPLLFLLLPILNAVSIYSEECEAHKDINVATHNDHIPQPGSTQASGIPTGSSNVGTQNLRRRDTEARIGGQIEISTMASEDRFR